MKKNILILIYIVVNLFFIDKINAQKFSAEPYLGLNIGKQSAASVTNGNHVNFHYGLKGNYEFKSNWTVNLGLGISNRRQEYKSIDTSSVLDNAFSFLVPIGIDLTEIEETLNDNGINLEEYKEINGVAKLMYLEIPLSVSYKIKSLQFDAGGYAGFLINSSKDQEVRSSIPALQAVDIESLDESGFLSAFLPSASSISEESITNSDNLDSFMYGIRLGVAYNYNSYIKFYGNYNLDLNSYSIDTDNQLTNKRSFFRFGIAYIIKKVEVNESKLKARLN